MNILLIFWIYDDYFMPMITPHFACAYYDIDMVVIWRYAMFGIML